MNPNQIYSCPSSETPTFFQTLLKYKLLYSYLLKRIFKYIYFHYLHSCI